MSPLIRNLVLLPSLQILMSFTKNFVMFPFQGVWSCSPNKKIGPVFFTRTMVIFPYKKFGCVDLTKNMICSKVSQEILSCSPYKKIGPVSFTRTMVMFPYKKFYGSLTKNFSYAYTINIAGSRCISEHK